MPEIRLVKRYPHIKDEDVTSIFQEGYIKGFENGRKGAIPMGWISEYSRKPLSNADYWAIIRMVTEWEKENE